MGIATSFTSDRMLDIEQNSVVSGSVDLNGDLILEKRSGSTINAGNVIGEEGPDGAPAGSIIAWPAIGIPNNWLECNGQAVDRDIYSDLYAIIGTQYGVGDGSTTFNVPDLRGRVIAGLDTSSSSINFKSLGEIGGAETVTLTISQLARHTHGQNAHSHTQSSHSHSVTGPSGGAISGAGGGGSGYSNGPGYAPWWGGGWNAVAGSVSSVAPTIQSAQPSIHETGNGDPINILQPYMAEKYIIKASGNIGELNSTVESVLLDRVSDVELETQSLQDEVSDLEAWKNNTVGNQKVLWSGAQFMNETQTVALSENVTDQINGIILVWQGYSGGQLASRDFSYHYVPKWHVITNNGIGLQNPMAPTVSGTVFNKYVYVFDDQIKGYTGNGTSPKNSHVLSTVIGF